MKTALVIEDNEDNHALIRFILEQSNYQVRHCDTGLAGVHLAISVQPNFIILDIQLPDIDGFEVLNRIRAHPAGETIPIIAMTSYAMAGDRKRLMDAGCNGYIEKPIDPLAVINQIEQILDNI